MRRAVLCENPRFFPLLCGHFPPISYSSPPTPSSPFGGTTLSSAGMPPLLRQSKNPRNPRKETGLFSVPLTRGAFYIDVTEITLAPSGLSVTLLPNSITMGLLRAH